MADKHFDSPAQRGLKSEARRIFSESEYPQSIGGTIVREMKDGLLLKTGQGNSVTFPVMLIGSVFSGIMGLSLGGELLNVDGPGNQSSLQYGLNHDFGYLAVQKEDGTSLVVVRDGNEYRVFELATKDSQTEMTYIPDATKAFFELAKSLERLRQYNGYLNNIQGQLPQNAPVIQQFDYVSKLYQDPKSNALQRSVQNAHAAPNNGPINRQYGDVIAQLENAAKHIRDGDYGFGSDSLPQDTQQIQAQEQLGFLRIFLGLVTLGGAGLLMAGVPTGIVRSGRALSRRRQKRMD